MNELRHKTGIARSISDCIAQLFVDPVDAAARIEKNQEQFKYMFYALSSALAEIDNAAAKMDEAG